MRLGPSAPPTQDNSTPRLWLAGTALIILRFQAFSTLQTVHFASSYSSFAESYSFCFSSTSLVAAGISTVQRQGTCMSQMYHLLLLPVVLALRLVHLLLALVLLLLVTLALDALVLLASRKPTLASDPMALHVEQRASEVNEPSFSPRNPSSPHPYPSYACSAHQGA